ncbi:DNA-binding protein [Methylobacterium sp. R2-1]|uniref:DNA-binding protein n=1 Tax=Methylobacterium sp. R2-1 TaxID=2587064 RepID=UPI001619FAA2|nr:DNA-binding protein [Methylobacterium sp. R2-1]MBB2965095.1 hypothetical protein [Methylobacterium sp. R2-1]
MGDEQNSDLLQGYEAIGRHLHMSPDATKHRVKSEGIPVFRMGRIVCARRSTLNAWLVEREAAAHTSKGRV